MNGAALADFRQQLPQSLLLEVAPVKDHLADLLPEERDIVAHAVASRRCEFSSARYLAHRLLREIGCFPQPLLLLDDRSPSWPQGVLGSLSHSRHWCAALITQIGGKILGVGVDLEDQRPLRAELFPEILTLREREALATIESREQQSVQALASFSLKEAVYKCMYPVGNTGLGFHAVEVSTPYSPSHPQLLPLDDLQRRLPNNSLLNAYQLRQNDAVLSVVLLIAT